MTTAIENALHRVINREALTVAETEAAIGEVMDGNAKSTQLAALLATLAFRGETVDEVVGAARAMHSRAIRIPTTQTGLLDTCGTGGDHLHTFNISTATAIVAAAAGVPVAKHGNRSASSRSGSADVLEALGVNVELKPVAVAECIQQVGIGFCYAPLVHGAMKHAAPIRRELGLRTVFNLLGPLTNPANAEFQLLGASRVSSAELLAGALASLGRRRAFVVCGADQLDEVALWGETTVFEVGSDSVRKLTWTPDDFGLPTCDVAELKVDSPEKSAERIRSIFAGDTGPSRDIVVANTAAALLTVNAVADLRAGVAKAAETIDSGTAQATLEKLQAFTQAHTGS
ncbi:anthranilate phosphoribosyltransferase [Thalassoroseus pseudoceratinae]|uniref:anthranilate phosphoribosyltransferase n=1 Tax=Thalassoroseus pseudoceratinae TaxID=2713176 RepID=UPI00142097DE|nr:anthranilate phosphoribosyltransferase [Thalassoroseus pseudoceratinae]